MSTVGTAYANIAPIAKAAAGLVLIALFGWYFWEDMVLPQEEMLRVKQEELNKITAELKESNTLLSTIVTEEALNNANEEFRKLMELLPDEPAIDKILNEFASISRLSGVEIREFTPSAIPSDSLRAGGSSANTPTSPGGSANNEESRSVTISLKLQGTFSSLVSFMDAALSLPRIIRIREFEFANQESQLKINQRPKLVFNGTFAAYFQGKNANAATKEVAGDDQPKPSDDTSMQKPLVDLNQIIEKNFSAKGSKEP